MSLNKKGYFQGGGGVNEPTPGKQKYHVDKAIVVQPRFKEPFYRNYDLYDTEGVSGPAQHGPGSGWNHMAQHDSIKEFLAFRRKRLEGKYVADDSWIENTPANYKERADKMKIRASVFNRIIKQADIEPNGMPKKLPDETSLHWYKEQHKSDENDGPNFDYGDGAYTAMSEGKKMKDITDAPHKSPGAFFADDNDLGTGFYENLEHYKSVRDFIEHTPLGYEHGAKIKPEWERAKHPPKVKKKKDVNHLDFPIDDMINRQDQMIYPEEGQYQIRREMGDVYRNPYDGDNPGQENLNISLTSPQIAGEHTYLPDEDFAGRSDDALNFGRDYDDEAPMPEDEGDFNLEELEDKYLTPSETDLFGLPDGMDPISDLDPDQTVDTEQPFAGVTDISTEMYDDKWNI